MTSTVDPACDVLIVDDDVDVAEAVSDTLRDAGHRVIVANGGDDALRLLNGGFAVPKVILLDLMMPGMNGWEFMAEQKKVPALAAIPVVIVSARTSSEPLEAAAYLRKPLKIADLLRVVARFAPPPAQP